MIISLRGFAGGFSLYTEGSAVEVGNFAAGSAAEAPDASIGWFNPAGLVLVKKQQALLSGVGVLPRTQITGSSHFATQDLDPYVQSFNSLSGAENALVPAIHYAQPLVADRVVWGLSVVSPFGLSTRWSESSPVRYEGTLTKLNTVNASPEIGVLLTEHWAVGLGLDMQWATVRFNAMGGAPTLVQYRNSFDDTLVLPSHGRPFTGLHVRTAQQHTHHADRLAEVYTACVVPQSTTDILPLMFKRKLDLHQTTFAMGEAAAHLHALYFEEKLTRELCADGIIRFTQKQ
jgi:long-subunit fatty acid transport protein